MEDLNTLGSQATENDYKPVVKHPTYTCNNSCNANGVSNGDADEKYLSSFPKGWKFAPTEQELLYYLAKKVSNKTLPPNKIKSANLYACGPEELLEKYRVSAEHNEWYFFTPRERKYRNGSRPKRAAGKGYWKATGVDRPIIKKGEKRGSRKTLVYYAGKPSKGKKTNYIMYEYVLGDGLESKPLTTKKKMADDDDDRMRLNAWVLCRIHKKVDKKSLKSDNQPKESLKSNNQPKETNLKADLANDVKEQFAVVEAKRSNLEPTTVANEEEYSFQFDDGEWDASIIFYHDSFDLLGPIEDTEAQQYNNQLIYDPHLSIYNQGVQHHQNDPFHQQLCSNPNKIELDFEEQKLFDPSQVEIKCMPNYLSDSSMTTSMMNDIPNNQMSAPHNLIEAPKCPPL